MARWTWSLPDGQAPRWDGWIGDPACPKLEGETKKKEAHLKGDGRLSTKAKLAHELSIVLTFLILKRVERRRVFVTCECDMEL